MEDAISAFRSLLSLIRIFRLGERQLAKLRDERAELYPRVMKYAKKNLGLPEDPEAFFTRAHADADEVAKRRSNRKGQVKGRWDSGARYFSLKRRRKRDWNEVLRLYDKVDYPEAD
jgi:glycerol-3-phosphate O-acyltransferase/dihydroxyacetone phosphate acyltransferase